MGNRIVPFNIALSLKKLGFKEPCTSFYLKGKLITITEDTCNILWSLDTENRFVSAPSYLQALRWFRRDKQI